MVQEVVAPEFAEEDVSEDISEASPASEVDPVAVLREELTATRAELATLSGLKALNPEQIARALGHIPALQRSVDELRKGSADPIATIDPRLSDSEEVLSDLVDALLASDILDDASKSGLRQRRQRMDAGRTERDRVRLRRELLSEVQEARETVQEQAAPTDGAQLVLEVQNATLRLMGYADAKGVEWTSIPAEELQFKQGETLEQSAARVRTAIDNLAGESDRVANRRRAAGAGAPPASGAGAFRTQRDVDAAHMDGRLTTAQVYEMRRNGRYAALPY